MERTIRSNNVLTITHNGCIMVARRVMKKKKLLMQTRRREG